MSSASTSAGAGGPLSPTSTTAASEPSASKSFWRRSSKTGSPNGSYNDTLSAQQDVPSKKRERTGGSRLSRLFKSSSTSTTGDGEDEKSAGSSAKKAGQKRREQVYNAQKRHRNRKAEYVQNLEAEIARLQQLDAATNAEKNAMAHQNRQMKELLTQNSLDFQLESMTVVPPLDSGKTDLSMLGSTGVEVRWDDQLGHERTFINWDEIDSMLLAFSGSSDTEPSTLSPTPPAPVVPSQSDNWAAVDWILALEWPCQGHIVHDGINPKARDNVPHEFSQCPGHALTATAAVYESAMAPLKEPPALADTLQIPGEQAANPAATQDKWQLPHSEIDKLVQMSQQLPIDDEMMTPAQAYSAIREAVPSPEALKPTLDALRAPLSEHVTCQGYGSVMPTEEFWRNLDKVMEEFNRAD